MKISRFFCLLFLSIFFFLTCEKSTEPIAVPEDGFRLKENAINIATLVVDFETYEFEGGNLRSFALEKASDSDSLPFVISYNNPGDLGSILFQLDKAPDTVFYGTITWHGEGRIYVPENILPPDYFKKHHAPIREPTFTKHYGGLSLPLLGDLAYDSTFNIDEKADSAWHSVKSLDIIKAFSKEDYGIGIYLYSPSVGAFVPSRAKWIIFLYAKIKAERIKSYVW